MSTISDINYELIKKYDVRGPRYTSYPTFPVWKDNIPIENLFSLYRGDNINRNSYQPDESKKTSLYIHVPFCRDLCWFCACNTKITRKSEDVTQYLTALKKEINWILGDLLPERDVFQFHWGGGTPTHLLPEQLEELFIAVTTQTSFSKNAEISMEVDPRVTTKEHLQTMASLGFNRISMGVQDFDLQVQKAIHRIQPIEQTAAIIEQARHLNFGSVSIDLMYGLPYQTEESFYKTLQKVIQLNPDRIALFSYAHVPWMKKAQKALERQNLPLGESKFRLFKLAIEFLSEKGFIYIGLDHFCKKDDELYKSLKQGTLQRNFMGYTTHGDTNLIGFGPSAISDFKNSYTQNEKDVSTYCDLLSKNSFPVKKGLFLSSDDILRKQIILDLSCQLELSISKIEKQFNISFHDYFDYELAQLKLMESELLTIDGDFIQVLPFGQILIRNICMIFDRYLRNPNSTKAQFSRTV